MTYDYICDCCSHAWEFEQRISDSTLAQCPACGSSRTHRVISGGAGFILKGAGWGKDLYASKKSSVKKDES